MLATTTTKLLAQEKVAASHAIMQTVPGSRPHATAQAARQQPQEMTHRTPTLVTPQVTLGMPQPQVGLVECQQPHVMQQPHLAPLAKQQPRVGLVVPQKQQVRPLGEELLVRGMQQPQATLTAGQKTEKARQSHGTLIVQTVQQKKALLPQANVTASPQ